MTTLAELVLRVPQGVQKRVKDTKDQLRSPIQDALRAECRLLLRTPEEAAMRRGVAQVPISVDPAYPNVIASMEFSESADIIMLFGRNRKILEQTKVNGPMLQELSAALTQLPQAGRWVFPESDQIENVANWASRLLTAMDRQDPLTKILDVNEDFLGVYEYDSSELLAEERYVNTARVRIYWAVIGLVSEWIGCTVEDLTIVVLVHELSHAYTQLGADIEGRRWPVRYFADAEPAVKEGLAQYYTDRVLKRLEKRFPGARNAYMKMLPQQPPIYNRHRMWLEKYTPEDVRRAMLEFRRRRETSIREFERRLKRAHRDLEPGN